MISFSASDTRFSIFLSKNPCSDLTSLLRRERVGWQIGEDEDAAVGQRDRLGNQSKTNQYSDIVIAYLERLNELKKSQEVTCDTKREKRTKDS